MPRQDPTPAVMAEVASRFKALADPTRLQILHLLRSRELTVSELVDATGLRQANVSKHLQVLHFHGFLRRRKDGLFSHYSLAGPEVFRLCDIMCGQLDRTGAPGKLEKAG